MLAESALFAKLRTFESGETTVMSVKPLALAAGALAVSASLSTVSATEPTASASAVISAIQGSALVSRQDDVVPATQGMELQPLNRVFVLEDSYAVVTFRDGCRQELNGDAMLTVSETGTCVAPDVALERSATGKLGEVFATVPAAAAPATVAALPILPIALGAVAAGGLIYAITDDDDDDNSPPPRSPISPQ
jgi:hypothetical protein